MKFLFFCSVFLICATPVFSYGVPGEKLIPALVVFLFIVPIILAKILKGKFLSNQLPEFYFNLHFPRRFLLFVTVTEHCFLCIICLLVFQLDDFSSIVKSAGFLLTSISLYLCFAIPLFDLLYLSKKTNPLVIAHKKYRLLEYSFLLGLMVPLALVLSLGFFYLTYPVWFLLSFSIF